MKGIGNHEVWGGGGAESAQDPAEHGHGQTGTILPCSTTIFTFLYKFDHFRASIFLLITPGPHVCSEKCDLPLPRCSSFAHSLHPLPPPPLCPPPFSRTSRPSCCSALISSVVLPSFILRYPISLLPFCSFHLSAADMAMPNWGWFGFGFDRSFPIFPFRTPTPRDVP